ncbi:MAG: hypothetical protein DRQ43_08035 [Gammaproteobacteria bacterium]|nr:MAG: hypothetical protein DRQ43_08035 [Gammaproteobacteria bacterium]
MKQVYYIIAIMLLVFMSSPVQAIEIIDNKGNYDAKLVDGKIYNDDGQYAGMITPDGKMYNEQGQYTGQIKNETLIDRNGAAKAYIRDGKIYDKEGRYKGRLKR